MRVGADDLDLEAGDAAVADLVERVGDAVHPADAVGDERDPQRLALAAGELALLAAEEGGRGRVRDRPGRTRRRGRAPRRPSRRRRSPPRGRSRRRAQAALVARRARRVQRRRARTRRPGGGRAARRRSAARSTASSQARSRARASCGTEVRADRAGAGVALGHHALDHPQDGARVGRGVAAAAAERADGEGHRGVRPLRGAALLAVRVDVARRGRGRGTRAGVGGERRLATRCGRCRRPRGRRTRRRRSPPWVSM